MQDKDLMENELLVVKGVCDLYLHGTIESTTAEVHTAFKEALNECLNIQNKIYNLMAEKGWYQTENAEQQKITAAEQKYSAQNNEFVNKNRISAFLCRNSIFLVFIIF